MEVIRIAASGDAVISREFTTIHSAYLVAGADAASAKVFDAATQTGDEKFQLKALANSQSDCVKLCNQFRNGVSVTLTGTSPVLYIVVE